MKSDLLKWPIILIVVLLILFFGYFGFSRNNSRPTVIPSASVTPSLIETEKKSFLGRAQINFPEVSSSQVMADSQLPADFSVFLFPDATDAIFKMFRYKNGQTGYQIDYNLNSSLFDTHTKFGLIFRQNASWQGLFGIRGDLFALKEMESDLYRVQISQSAINENKTMVSIKIITK